MKCEIKALVAVTSIGILFKAFKPVLLEILKIMFNYLLALDMFIAHLEFALD